MYYAAIEASAVDHSTTDDKPTVFQRRRADRHIMQRRAENLALIGLQNLDIINREVCSENSNCKTAINTFDHI